MAVFLSIPLSALAAIIGLYFGGSSINSMVLAGLALVFSRLIDNAVIVLENIFRHLELGESPEVAAEKGGQEVSLAVLAATLTSAVVFFPVTFLYGVSRFLFSALALAVVLALFASYVVAMTVVPLFCARFIKSASHVAAVEDGSELRLPSELRLAAGYSPGVNGSTNALASSSIASLKSTSATCAMRYRARRQSCGDFSALSFSVLLCFRFSVLAFFPRTDAGQFVINVKAPSGTRVEITNQEVARVENIIRETVAPKDLKLIVSNIGVIPGFSSIYTSNSGPHTATVQVALNEGHTSSSFEYMDRVRHKLQRRHAGTQHLFSIRRHGGCGAESGLARSDRCTGQWIEFGFGFHTGRPTWLEKSGRFPA